MMVPALDFRCFHVCLTTTPDCKCLTSPPSFIARCDGWLGVRGSAAEQDLYRGSGRSYVSHLFSHVRQLLYVGVFGIQISGTPLVSHQRIRGTRSWAPESRRLSTLMLPVSQVFFIPKASTLHAGYFTSRFLFSEQLWQGDRWTKGQHTAVSRPCMDNRQSTPPGLEATG